MKNIKSKIVCLIYDYIYIPIFFNVIYLRDLKKIKRIYGDFECLNKKDQKKLSLLFKNEFKNVTGLLISEIVKTIIDLNLKPSRVLLDGDDKSVIEQVREKFSFNEAKIMTVGWDGNFDYEWDFEDDYPSNMPRSFDLIISQAMFEHLVDPYKHFVDLAKLLQKGGYLIIHSVMPGYTYHRYPIDSIRFFPDWFEHSALKNNLKVKRKFMRDFHLIYLFEKL